MEDPEARRGQQRPRRLDPKAASLAGFLSPHANANANSASGGGGGGGGWKARLKERCLNRVRQERDRLVQEMRGLASPPPPPTCSGAGGVGVGVGEAQQPYPPPPPQQQPPPAAAPASFLTGAVSPPPILGAVEGGGGRRRSSTPSSFSGAALEILWDEMRAARRERQGQGRGEGDDGVGEGEGGALMAIAEKEGEEGEGEQLSPEEHWELMRCIEEALAQEVSLAEEWAAGEYSQLEHAEVEGSVAQLYDYEELPADDAAVLCPRCKANYLLLPHGAIGPRSRPGSSASHHSHHSGVGATTPVACACGLRVELCAPGMGLAQLQERLAAVYGHHRASACPVREPNFYQREPGRDLWVECGACGLHAQVV